MLKTLSAFAALALGVNCQAAEFGGLQRLGAAGVSALAGPAAPAASPAGIGGFRVTGNAPLLTDFSNHLDYRGTNGQTIFPYTLRSLRFYRLTGWPRHLLAQVDDRTLPNFHNFLVLSLAPAGDTGHAVLYAYDSENQGETYTASTVAEKICALDRGCARLDPLKREEEKKLRAALPSWEAPYFGALRDALTRKVLAHYGSDKFSKLGRAELDAAGARFTRLAGRASPAGGGRAALLAENDREWRLEHCGASSAELLERVRQAPPEQQDTILLRCGLVLDAEWLIKKHYEDEAVAALNSGCLAAGAGGAYCVVYRDWLRFYTLKTALEELALADGNLPL